ncbi:MAG TPA: HAD-IIA family hydrolase [Ornithinimicrobium sp.]|uniref:HAD-IIA family hydrolase n=1 Tax=Ornithinimicrobium sp. TaxID=1977084 RepID=UPI002B463A7A|nr:HAD-IIA family hydrolase [Ornithinimicrobium sp.]HKJ11729.1 HAD-IIA family hydrolase [Ornithinimicrobium sp.]
MAFRAVVFDLDGVLYRGGQLCPGAKEGTEAVRQDGLSVLFMTNNASRTPEQVAEHLRSLGIEADPGEVLNSSQVGAAHLAQMRDGAAEDEPDDPLVLAVGGPGVAVALAEEGFACLAAGDVPEEGPPRPFWAVLQGYGPAMKVHDLHEVAYALHEGAIWVATNADSTLPTSRGIAPGNGALLAAVTHGTGCTPDVVGKPFPRSYGIALDKLGLPSAEVLAVGDRLDTDIEGARAAGLRSALVLTGVHGRADADAAPTERRPDLVVERIPDLREHWR